jgi:chorismate mutase
VTQATDRSVSEARERITAVDERIVELVNERLAAVEELKRRKVELGLPFLDPRREADLRAHLHETNAGPLSALGLDELHGFILELVKRELSDG